MRDVRREFRTVDTHTGGEPTRILLDGFDPESLSGETVAERRSMFELEFDWLRELLLKEPRGHENMFGAVPLGPGPGTDLDVFFMDNSGYLDMCGHALIGVVTALCEMGRLDPETVRRIGTPAGIVEVRPTVTDGRLEEITFHNVDSYVVAERTVEVDGRAVPVTVAAAGNYVVLANLEHVDTTVEEAAIDDLVEFGLALRAAVNDLALVDPVTGDPVVASLTELYDPGDIADRTLVVFGDGLVDRSPCGTGTAAKLAALYDRGALSVDEPYVQESPIGTRFEGRVHDVRTEDGVTIVTPAVTGRAYRTGEHTFYLDRHDDLGAFSFGD